jgi:hypothetical protein
VHNFRTSLVDLATLTRNLLRLAAERQDIVFAAPTRLQRRALHLLGVTQLA